MKATTQKPVNHCSFKSDFFVKPEVPATPPKAPEPTPAPTGPHPHV